MRKIVRIIVDFLESVLVFCFWMIAYIHYLFCLMYDFCASIYEKIRIRIILMRDPEIRKIAKLAGAKKK